MDKNALYHFHIFTLSLKINYYFYKKRIKIFLLKFGQNIMKILFLQENNKDILC